MIKFLFVLLSVENIYLCMSKSPRQKKKLKLKVTKRGKRRHTSKSLSNNRKVTMKKKGGSMAGMTMPVITEGMPNLQNLTMGLEKSTTLQNFLEEDLERKGAFILREILHLIRQSAMLGSKGDIVEVLKLMVSSSGPSIDAHLKARVKQNSDITSIAQQEMLMYSQLYQPPNTKGSDDKEPKG